MRADHGSFCLVILPQFWHQPRERTVNGRADFTGAAPPGTPEYIVATLVLSALLGGQLALQLLSAAFMTLRLRRPEPIPRGIAPRPTTLIVSVAGLTAPEARIAALAIALADPKTEILFCAASPDEPGVQVIRDALSAAGRTNDPDIRMLFTPYQPARNPKLANIRIGYETARHDAVVLLDGNIEVPGDFLARLWQVWNPGVGVVSTVPIAVGAETFWASVETTMLNGIFARWLLAGDRVGIIYASGKVLAFSRAWLNSQGGLNALQTHVAEDISLTILARRSNRKVRLIRQPLVQPLGRRTAADFLGRAGRWAKSRRTDVPIIYVVETTYSLWSLLLISGLWAGAVDVPLTTVWAGIFILWHVTEAAMVRFSGLGWSPALHLYILVRDVLVLPIWISGWFGRHYTWRGQKIRFR